MANIPDYPLELGGKTLLLKTPCIRVTEQGEIKLTLIWKLHSYWLALLCRKAPYVLAEEKADYKYPPVNPVNYHNWPDKMFTLVY